MTIYVVFFLQTCYEMERYLKDEPKHHGSKNQISSNLDSSPWDMFAAPGGPLSGSWKVEMIDDKLNLDHDTLSTTSSSSSCSRLSWDAPLSCAVVVKNEPMDEDYDDNSDGYEENSFTSSSSSSTKYHHISSSSSSNNSSSKLRNLESHRQNSIELTLLARSTLPTLTPPSSPEPNSKSNQERKVLRITSGTTLPRNAIVRLTNGRNSIGVARLIHVNSKYQTVDSKNISVSTTGKLFLNESHLKF